MPKLAKSEAQYTESPTKNQGRCRDCTMERDGARRCTAVEGVIKPDAHCRLFARKKGTKNG